MTLFIFDGAGSHRVEGGLFLAACKRNNIDVAVIPASCTDEIQLMDVVVNAKKDSMYYQWAMWMMNGPRRVQLKSRNFITSDVVTVLSWCAYAWGEVKNETILSGVAKRYLSADPGPKLEVEAKPEAMQIEGEEKKKNQKKKKKKIVVVKSKTLAELERLAKKKERARKKIERAKKKFEKERHLSYEFYNFLANLQHVCVLQYISGNLKKCFYG